MLEAVRRFVQPVHDRRSQERQTMILRVGVLIQDHKTSFCLVRNVSSAGVQVKLYSRMCRLGDVVIRVADEDPIRAKVVWIKKQNAGIEFDTSIDPGTLLRLQQKLSPLRRRSMPRIKATSYAAVRVDSRNVQAVLRDISSTGARITTSRPLEVDTRVWVRLPDLPELRANVRWTDGTESGLAFEPPFPMQVIGEWIDGRLRVSD